PYVPPRFQRLAWLRWSTRRVSSAFGCHVAITASADGQSQQSRGGEQRQLTMRAQPELATRGFGDVVEAAVRRDVGRLHGLPEIVRPVGVLGLGRLLGVDAVLSKIAIEVAGGNAISNDGLHRWPTDEQFSPTVVVDRVPDRGGADFRLKHRWNGLPASRQPTLHPVELRRVHRRHFDYRHANATLLVQQ